MTTSIEAVFTEDQDGRWLVEVPNLEGCHTYGGTLGEARVHAQDAVALWLETDDFELTEVVNASA